MAWAAEPDNDEWADISFFMFPLPHFSQCTDTFSEKTSTSAAWPQSVHKKSNSGICLSIF
jgi:hypothetical protein